MQVRELTTAQKNPKVFSEAVGWAAEAIGEFGIGAISPSEPIAFALAALENRDAGVRSAAMTLLLAVRRFFGAKLLDSPLLKDLKDVSAPAFEPNQDAGCWLPAAGHDDPMCPRIV